MMNQVRNRVVLASHFVFFVMIQQLPSSMLFPYTTLFRSHGTDRRRVGVIHAAAAAHLAFALGALLGEDVRSEEHTSELQSQSNLVCRLLLEKKNSDFSFDVQLSKPQHYPCESFL